MTKFQFTRDVEIL